MKMYVAGLKHLSGVSKKSGDPFSMPTLFGLVKVETFTKEKLKCVGYGWEPMEVQLDPDCILQFAAYETKFPCLMDLETDVVPKFGDLVTVVIGVKALVAVVPPKAA